jgi:hypothetical protein
VRPQAWIAILRKKNAKTIRHRPKGRSWSTVKRSSSSRGCGESKIAFGALFGIGDRGLQKGILVRQYAKNRLDVVLGLLFPGQFIERWLVTSLAVTTFRDVKLLVFIVPNVGTVLIAPAIPFSMPLGSIDVEYRTAHWVATFAKPQSRQPAAKSGLDAQAMIDSRAIVPKNDGRSTFV